MTDAARSTPSLTRYKCHKIVQAAQIIWRNGLMLELRDYGTIEMTVKWMEKHDPQIGGYYVRYDDGYASYSPAKAFEEGYTLLAYAEIGQEKPHLGGISRSTVALDGRGRYFENEANTKKCPYCGGAMRDGEDIHQCIDGGEAMRKAHQLHEAAISGIRFKGHEVAFDPPTAGPELPRWDWLSEVEQRHRLLSQEKDAWPLLDTRFVHAMKDVPQLIAEIKKLRGYAFPAETAPQPHPLPPTWERVNANGRHVRMRKIIGAGCIDEAQVKDAPGPVRLFFEGGSSEVVHGRLVEFALDSWWVESMSGRCYVINEAAKFDLFDEQGPR
jgi:hypothetical protein